MQGKMAEDIGEHQNNDAIAVDQNDGPQQNNDARSLVQNEEWSPQFDLLNDPYKPEIPGSLYKAALEGSWRKAARNLGDDPQTRKKRVGMAITIGGATVLHVAAGARQTRFVKKILHLMEPSYEDLRRKDLNGNNAFCIAAGAGAVQIAKLMLQKDRDLSNIPGNEDRTPLQIALKNGQQEMAELLFFCTRETMIFEGVNDLFFACIATGMYDFAIILLNTSSFGTFIGPMVDLAMIRQRETRETALHMLVRKPSPPSVKAVRLVILLWDRIRFKQHETIKDLITRPTNLLVEATKQGHFEIVATVVRCNPDLIGSFFTDLNIVFQAAIAHRKVISLSIIFSLSYETGFLDSTLASYHEYVTKNNMLHLAAKYPDPDPPPPSSAPSPALQMQQEIIFFEEMERIALPYQKDEINADGHTPKELFITTHKELKERGGKWMKSTANHCMLVATLIATVVFAAAFTVPGGYNQESGKPIHLQKVIFKIFVVADAIALSSSAISILIFLSILTSHFTIEDFRMWLPLKLMVGLLSFFISVITMTISFSSSFFLFYSYRERVNWITVSVAVMVSVPVTIHVVLQYPLLKNIFYSAFRFRRLIKPKSLVLSV